MVKRTIEMRIEKLDNQFDTLIAPDTMIEQIADGFTFTEGPLWNSRGNFLLFSDIPESKIFKWSEKNGVEIYRQISHFSNGLTYDSKGQLIACEHQSRSITRELTRGDVVPLASHYKGKKLNSPNDVIATSDGSILFTDPIYGLRAGMGGPADPELSFQGVYRIKPDNELELITDGFERPNGLAFSPDGKTLYIADTVRQHLRAFSVDENWRFTGGQIWAELWDESVTGRPDGLKVDLKGNVFSAGPGGIWVFNANAEVLGRIYLDGKTSNLAWGEDGHSLFITCSSVVYRIKCRTEGKILPF
jgi:sugar lactone lactonase YvrE